MSGAATGSPGDEFRAWMAKVERDLDELKARARGPVRGWDYTRTPGVGTPGLVEAGTSVVFPLVAADGTTITDLTDRVTALEQQTTTLPEGWEWEQQGDDLLGLRLPDGRLFVMQQNVGSVPGPVHVYGDSNTTSVDPVVVGQVPWIEQAGPAVRNHARSGKGWVYAPVGQRIGDDIIATPAPWGTFILNGGINDIANGIPVGQIETAINVFAAYCVERSWRVEVATILPTRGGYAGYMPNVDLVNNWIRATWPTGTAGNVQVLDIAAPVTSAGLLDAAYSLDGLHLNADGHAVVAAYVRSQTGMA